MNTTQFFDRLVAHTSAARGPAVIGDGTSWRYADLLIATTRLAGQLQQSDARVVATLLDNGPIGIAADLAALLAEVVHVPLPLFFTAEQIAGALVASGADTLICPLGVADRFAALGFSPRETLQGDLVLLHRQTAPVAIHAGTAKITFTSGSTGQPKGVCLTAASMFAVAESLVSATADLGLHRHVNALPLAVLLENIAGVYAPLLAGATCITLPLDQVGLIGSSQFDPMRLHAVVEHHDVQSLITLPQMLRAYAGMLAACRLTAPPALRFVAVGGAAVGRAVLDQAHALGIPAYEGYGLSEGASVQTLNVPSKHLHGSAGRPLSHAKVRIVDGEIQVAGTASLGYLGAPAQLNDWLPTGDLGDIDAQGYLHIQGRKKNLLITGFGRNVSPEWVETALRSHPAILQAVVMGDAQPALGAVIWPTREDTPDGVIQSAIDAANASLPDYARISPWLRADRPFTTATGLATANGRPRRDVIAATYPQLFPPLARPTRAAASNPA